jgi:hypothetical protein
VGLKGIGFTSTASRTDWEKWRAEQSKWRMPLREKEAQLRARLAEGPCRLGTAPGRPAEGTRGGWATDAAGTVIDAAEPEDNSSARRSRCRSSFAQKTAELQLPQRRVRGCQDAHRLRSTSRSVYQQVAPQKTPYRMQGRVREVEREFENFRAYSLRGKATRRQCYKKCRV